MGLIVMDNSVKSPWQSKPPAKTRTSFLWLVAGMAAVAVVLGGCGGAKFDPNVVSLFAPVEGRFVVEPGITYSVPFECLLALPRNSTAVAKDMVSLDEVLLERNPRRTFSSDILTSVENARIVSREFETWIWLESLDEIEINSPNWPQDRVRNATKRQLYWAMRKYPKNAPTLRGPLRSEYYRARVVEYRLEGSLKFRIPSGLAKDIEGIAGVSREGAGFYLPFIFASPYLPGEGVGFVIEQTPSDGEDYGIRVSQGTYCDRFKDRNIWR